MLLLFKLEQVAVTVAAAFFLHLADEVFAHTHGGGRDVDPAGAVAAFLFEGGEDLFAVVKVRVEADADHLVLSS